MKFLGKIYKNGEVIAHCADVFLNENQVEFVWNGGNSSHSINFKSKQDIKLCNDGIMISSYHMVCLKPEEINHIKIFLNAHGFENNSNQKERDNIGQIKISENEFDNVSKEVEDICNGKIQNHNEIKNTKLKEIYTNFDAISKSNEYKEEVREFNIVGYSMAGLFVLELEGICKAGALLKGGAILGGTAAAVLGGSAAAGSAALASGVAGGMAAGITGGISSALVGGSTAIGTSAITGTTAAFGGAAAGSAVGSVVPIIGTIIGAGVGLAVGVTAGKIKQNKANQKKNAYLMEMQKKYLQLIESLEKEIKFYEEKYKDSVNECERYKILVAALFAELKMYRMKFGVA